MGAMEPLLGGFVDGGMGDDADIEHDACRGRAW